MVLCFSGNNNFDFFKVEKYRMKIGLLVGNFFGFFYLKYYNVLIEYIKKKCYIYFKFFYYLFLLDVWFFLNICLLVSCLKVEDNC